MAAALGWAILPGLALAQPTAGQRNAFGVPDAPQQAEPEPGGLPAPSYSRPGHNPPLYTPQPPSFQPAAPQYGQAPQQAPLSIQQYLAGTWHGITNDGSGQWEVFASFQADGTFVQQQFQQQPQGMMRLGLTGRYDAQLGPDGGGTLTLRPLSWEPRQVCQSPGNCRPVNLPPSISTRFRPMGQDMLQTQEGNFQRIGPAQ